MPTIKAGNRVFHVTDIDREECSRIVPMRVLSLGLTRTGSESLMDALRILGYHEAYHGYQAMISNPRDCEMWLKALRAKYDGVGQRFGREEWDKLLGHCQAVSDIPAICFAEDLIQAYPEAKVIVTVRDVDDWYESMMTLVTAIDTPLNKYLLVPLISITNTLLHSRFRLVPETFLKAGLYLYGEDIRTTARETYRNHVSRIQALVPKDRLLLYHVKEGWEPLCAYLGQPVPAVPVPNGNSKADMLARHQACMRLNLRECGWKVVRGVVLIGVVGWVVRREGVRWRGLWDGLLGALRL
ncbi:NAD dependent epimerase/dehydratase [Aspergillus indologenus CBS 114.80]|uniref:NAD dependent epimerase/dehydratase n=1 Tax=Aspergillus indologenus CBS 114.80 TaxID=1450541 RepID=A0A2V5I639_9EURO|nr:NAD dependent epimerase/dehydratase [Aspergillus indologenus CBS 114.80]